MAASVSALCAVLRASFVCLAGVQALVERATPRSFRETAPPPPMAGGMPERWTVDGAGPAAPFFVPPPVLAEAVFAGLPLPMSQSHAAQLQDLARAVLGSAFAVKFVALQAASSPALLHVVFDEAVPSRLPRLAIGHRVQIAPDIMLTVISATPMGAPRSALHDHFAGRDSGRGSDRAPSSAGGSIHEISGNHGFVAARRSPMVMPSRFAGGLGAAAGDTGDTLSMSTSSRRGSGTLHPEIGPGAVEDDAATPLPLFSATAVEQGGIARGPPRRRSDTVRGRTSLLSEDQASLSSEIGPGVFAGDSPGDDHGRKGDSIARANDAHPTRQWRGHASHAALLMMEPQRNGEHAARTPHGSASARTLRPFRPPARPSAPPPPSHRDPKTPFDDPLPPGDESRHSVGAGTISGFDPHARWDSPPQPAPLATSGTGTASSLHRFVVGRQGDGHHHRPASGASSDAADSDAEAAPAAASAGTSSASCTGRSQHTSERTHESTDVSTEYIPAREPPPPRAAAATTSRSHQQHARQFHPYDAHPLYYRHAVVDPGALSPGSAGDASQSEASASDMDAYHRAADLAGNRDDDASSGLGDRAHASFSSFGGPSRPDGADSTGLKGDGSAGVVLISASVPLVPPPQPEQHRHFATAGPPISVATSMVPVPLSILLAAQARQSAARDQRTAPREAGEAAGRSVAVVPDDERDNDGDSDDDELGSGHHGGRAGAGTSISGSGNGASDSSGSRPSTPAHQGDAPTSSAASVPAVPAHHADSPPSGDSPVGRPAPPPAVGVARLDEARRASVMAQNAAVAAAAAAAAGIPAWHGNGHSGRGLAPPSQQFQLDVSGGAIAAGPAPFGSGPGAPGPAAAGPVGPGTSTRIFLNGVPAHVAEPHVREHFGRFGQVKDVYFPVFHAMVSAGTRGALSSVPTRKRRGFCFVTMSTPAEVDAALAYSDHVVGGFHVPEMRRARPRQGGATGPEPIPPPPIPGGYPPQHAHPPPPAHAGNPLGAPLHHHPHSRLSQHRYGFPPGGVPQPLTSSVRPADAAMTAPHGGSRIVLGMPPPGTSAATAGGRVSTSVLVGPLSANTTQLGPFAPAAPPGDRTLLPTDLRELPHHPGEFDPHPQSNHHSHHHGYGVGGALGLAQPHPNAGTHSRTQASGYRNSHVDAPLMHGGRSTPGGHFAPQHLGPHRSAHPYYHSHEAASFGGPGESHAAAPPQSYRDHFHPGQQTHNYYPHGLGGPVPPHLSSIAAGGGARATPDHTSRIDSAANGGGTRPMGPAGMPGTAHAPPLGPRFQDHLREHGIPAFRGPASSVEMGEDLMGLHMAAPHSTEPAAPPHVPASSTPNGVARATAEFASPLAMHRQDAYSSFPISAGFSALAPAPTADAHDDAGRETAEASLAALTLEDDHHGIAPGLIGHGDEGVFGSAASGGFAVLNSSIWRSE